MLHRTQELTEGLADLRSMPEVAKLQPIPDSLLSLSNRSMERLRGSSFNPRLVSLVDLGVEDGDSDEQLDLRTSSISSGLKRTVIAPRREPVQIAACDASSVKIGETETGMIFAIRAVAVWRQPERIAFTRWGPLLFHIPNSDGQQEKYRDDESRAFGGLSVKTLRVLTKLRNHVERWVQEELAMSV